MRGVWYDQRRGRYRARVYRHYRVVHLSYHNTEEEAINAINAYNEAASPESDHAEQLLSLARLALKRRSNWYGTI